jgi:heme/copper-type cytochrome/quinol oxidase subunit 1
LEAFVLRFIRSSLVWLAVGVVLGVGIAIWPRLLLYRAAHMHANLLGFVSMMIFGVAYHVLPRFVGRPLHSRRLAVVHLWVANAGLALLVGGWMLRPHLAGGTYVLHGGALVSATGAFFFIYNIWRTLGASRAGAPVGLAGPRRSPPR